METITNAVNTVASTVTNTIWGASDSDHQKEQKEQKETKQEGQQYPAHSTFTHEETSSLDRYPSVMGTVTPPADARYENPDAVASDLASLSLNKGSDNRKLEMSHDQTGYPFSDTTNKEETITGSSTGNTATLFTLIDAGGSADRDLEGADPRKGEKQAGHRRQDSGVHGLEYHDQPDQSKYGAEKNDDSGSRNSNSKITSNTQKPTHDPEHTITSRANVGSQREGLSSSNEPSSQGEPSSTGTAIPPMGPGLSSRAGGPTEPSVGSDPSSAAQPKQKHQGADRPNEAPKESSQQSESADTGEKYVESSGTAAEGGDFDARNPGAGKEADRLLEKAGVHRNSPGENHNAEPHEGNKFGQHLKHPTARDHNEHGKSGKPDPKYHGDEHQGGPQPEGEHEKKKLSEKIKEKLHIKKDRH